MTSIAEKILAISVALDDQRPPYAFGGALALAFCTKRARGTIDIDLNVFVGRDDARVALDALPPQVGHTDGDLRALESNRQVRSRWDQTPVDVLLHLTEFHVEAAQRRQHHEFGDRRIPVLGCSDLAVFKAFFNRTRDWADLEEIIAMRALNVDQTIGVLVRYLGGDDERVERLRRLTAPAG